LLPMRRTAIAPELWRVPDVGKFGVRALTSSGYFEEVKIITVFSKWELMVRHCCRNRIYGRANQKDIVVGVRV